MTADEYLNQVITNYLVNEESAKLHALAIRPVIQRWAGLFLMEIIFSGSIAKGTAISLSTDADIFISLSSTTPNTLSEIYNRLFDALKEAGYQPRKQNVSIRAISAGYKIDFVPGKRQSQYGFDHGIYKNKGNTWTKTNVKTHINHVANSSRLKEIKLTKIWRERNNLDFPSFYLDLAVIDYLLGCSYSDLSGNFWKVLGFLASDFVDKEYIDPANTNNIISDDLTASEKKLIRSAAQESRKKTNWEQIVW